MRVESLKIFDLIRQLDELIKTNSNHYDLLQLPPLYTTSTEICRPRMIEALFPVAQNYSFFFGSRSTFSFKFVIIISYFLYFF